MQVKRLCKGKVPPLLRFFHQNGLTTASTWLIVIGLPNGLALFGLVAPAVPVLRGPSGSEEVKVSGRFSANSARILIHGCLAGLGIAIGFALIIFPGLYLVTIWSVVVPVIVGVVGIGLTVTVVVAL